MSGERFYIDYFGEPIRCYDKDGEYVSYKDYEVLKAENQRLREALTKIVGMTEYEEESANGDVWVEARNALVYGMWKDKALEGEGGSK